MRTEWLTYLLVATLVAPLPVLGNNFSDNGNGTVTDATTNLIWQKCSATEAPSSINNDNSYDPTCSGTPTAITWQNGLSYCKNLSLAGRSWRLPSVNELKSLLDQNPSVAPLIDTSNFPGLVASYAIYWTGTTYVSSQTSAWLIHFSIGAVYTDLKNGNYYVRCVSSGP